MQNLPHQLCKKFTKYSQKLLNIFSSFTNFLIAGEGIENKNTICYILYSDAAENQYSDSWKGGSTKNLGKQQPRLTIRQQGICTYISKYRLQQPTYT